MLLTSKQILFTFGLLCLNLSMVSISFAGSSSERIEVNSQGEVESLYTANSIMPEIKYGDRFSAANFASRLSNLDTVWAIDILVQGIELELVDPVPIGYPRNSYLTYSQSILRTHVFSLARLGQSVLSALVEKREILSGSLREWVTIALGYQKDPRVHKDIRDIFIKTSDPNLKAMAAICLGIYQDTIDSDILIPEFYASYNDNGYFNPDSMGIKPPETFNLVFEEVAGALRLMGYNTVWDSTKSEWYLEKR